jgi:hypothetical protein
MTSCGQFGTSSQSQHVYKAGEGYMRIVCQTVDDSILSYFSGDHGMSIEPEFSVLNSMNKVMIGSRRRTRIRPM